MKMFAALVLFFSFQAQNVFAADINWEKKEVFKISQIIYKGKKY